MGSDPAQCLICLENFTEDSAYIPELECECAIFVHWTCWEPWNGGCLYCREIELEDDIVVPIGERRYVIELYMVYNEWTSFFLRLAVGFFTLYFFILLNHKV